FTPDGKRLAACSFDGTVRVYDAATGKFAVSLPVAGQPVPVRALAWSPDGKRMACATVTDSSVRVWDVETRQQVASFRGLNGQVWALASRPDGKGLAAVAGQQVLAWNVTAGTGELVLTGHSQEVRALAFSPDGKRLATAGNDMSVRVWDAAA